MQCPLCQEENFSDATNCRFCGALLPTPVTGATQRLDPADVRLCARCQHVMEPGYLAQPRGYDGAVCWVAGKPDHWQGQTQHDRRRMLPVSTYRCLGCGALEMSTPPG